jgi:hypothetical protein
MLKRSFLVLCLLALGLAACAPAASAPAATSAPAIPRMDSSSGANKSSVSQEAPAAPPAPGLASAYDAAGNIASAPDRLVIQNADLTIVVDEPAKAMDAVSNMAKQMGGFVVTSNLSKTSNSEGIEIPQANITVRVPAEKLDDALTQIKGLTKNPKEDVRSENRSGQDVTKEYTDAQSRLTNLQQAETQLREIMASAQKTEDVITVFNQLTQIREQIEVIKGQIKFYEESAALSAINLQIMAQAAVAPLTIGSWKPAGVARDAIQSLIDALQFLANLAIWLVLYLLPIGLLIGLPIWLVVALIRRSRVRRKAVTPPPA